VPGRQLVLQPSPEPLSCAPSSLFPAPLLPQQLAAFCITLLPLSALYREIFEVFLAQLHVVLLPREPWLPGSSLGTRRQLRHATLDAVEGLEVCASCHACVCVRSCRGGRHFRSGEARFGPEENVMKP
jgi:hypothetical protein